MGRASRLLVRPPSAVRFSAIQSARTAPQTKSRYRWTHFEKILYDNAQLARVYLRGYQITGSEFYKRITTEILDYIVREMADPNGGFYSSQDADSEGHKGKFFAWSPDEIRGLPVGISSGLLIVSKTK